jgi:hypothetical protein
MDHQCWSTQDRAISVGPLSVHSKKDHQCWSTQKRAISVGPLSVHSKRTINVGPHKKDHQCWFTQKSPSMWANTKRPSILVHTKWTISVGPHKKDLQLWFNNRFTQNGLSVLAHTKRTFNCGLLSVHTKWTIRVDPHKNGPSDARTDFAQKS